MIFFFFVDSTLFKTHILFKLTFSFSAIAQLAVDDSVSAEETDALVSTFAAAWDEHRSAAAAMAVTDTATGKRPREESATVARRSEPR
jgi:hypothetical protein